MKHSKMIAILAASAAMIGLATTPGGAHAPVEKQAQTAGAVAVVQLAGNGKRWRHHRRLNSRGDNFGSIILRTGRPDRSYHAPRPVRVCRWRYYDNYGNPIRPHRHCFWDHRGREDWQ